MNYVTASEPSRSGSWREHALNLFATYASTAVTLLWPILSTPFFAGQLGPSSWGLVSFAMLLLLGATMLEAGFSQGLIKEFAELRAGPVSVLRQVLLGVGRWYGLCSAGLGAALLVLAWPISGSLIGASDLSRIDIALGVGLAGLLVAGQLPSALCRSTLIALECHRVNAVVNIVMQSLKYGGGMVVVFMWPAAFALLVWFGVCAVSEALIRWLSLGIIIGRRFSTDSVIFDDWGTVRFIDVQARVRLALARSARMSLAVLLGAAVMYIDRAIVVHQLALADLGYYTIAGTAALGLVQAIYPIGQIAIPRMISAGNEVALRRRLNLRVSLAIMFFLFFAGLVYVLEGRALVRLWLRKSEIYEAVQPLVDILIFGSLFNALSNIGYWNWIADGARRSIFRAHLITLVLTLPSTWVLTERFGLRGAAFGWVASNLVGFILSLGWVRFFRVQSI